MAYKSKYYDPAKAHEYYMKHRQLKGRKKKTSTADLSEEGKIAAKEVKERLQEELKAALKKVKRGNTAERKRLRELYQKKYEAELDEIRKDTSMVKAPKQKKQKQPKQAKQRTAKSNSGGSNSKSSKSSAPAKAKPQTESEKILDAVNRLKAKMATMDERKKEAAKEIITKLIEQYKKRMLAE